MAIWKRISKYDKDINIDEEYAQEVEKKMKETEKGDIPSMLLSAFLILWLPCVVILILICVGAYVLLGLPFAGQDFLRKNLQIPDINATIIYSYILLDDKE